MTFGEQIKNYRKENNLSQKAAADLFEIGQSTLSRIETDTGYMSQEVKERIEKTIGISEPTTPEELLEKICEKYEVDNVNSPNHYQLENLGIEVIDVMRSNLGDEGFKNYCKGNVIKYILRAEKKNGLEDYKKAAKYLNWIIEAAENGSK